MRTNIATIYDGLPLDEPRFTLRYLSPEAFTGFGRHGEIFFGLEKTASTRSINTKPICTSANPCTCSRRRRRGDGRIYKRKRVINYPHLSRNERKEKIRRIKNP